MKQKSKIQTMKMKYLGHVSGVTNNKTVKTEQIRSELAMQLTLE